jgi:hypothetical protein
VLLFGTETVLLRVKRFGWSANRKATSFPRTT